jgi:hypothetical protein
MPVDFDGLRTIYNASTDKTFPNDLRTIIDALKQGNNEYYSHVANSLEAIDTSKSEGRAVARQKLSSLFNPDMSRRGIFDAGRRRKTRKPRRKSRKTRKTSRR